MRDFTLYCLALCLFAACQSGDTTKASAPVQKTAAPAASSAEETAPAKILTEATLDLTSFGIANDSRNVLGGLKVGDKAPNIILGDQYNKEVNLEDKLHVGPMLLVFFRAEWCGYCVKHLQEFKEQIRDISAMGKTRVLAVSPQMPHHIQKMYTKNMFPFPILYDKDHQTMKDYKVFYHVTEAYNDKIKEFAGQPIEVLNGDKEPVMPVPATYLIGQDMRIKYVHYDPDYKERSDIKEVLAAF